MIEVWKDIPWHEGKYQVSNFGSVRSLDRIIYYKDGRHRPAKGKILSSGNPEKYKTVSLGLKNSKDVHRLVAEAFCFKSNEEKNSVNHIDGNKHNNHYKNLEWVTPKENNQHAVKTKLNIAAKGEETGSSVLTEKDVRHIRDEYFYCDRSYGINKKLSRGYGVSTTTIHKIVNYNKWKHVR